MSFRWLRLLRCRFPHRIHRRRQRLELAHEIRNAPQVGIRHLALPPAHARVAHAVAHEHEDLRYRIVVAPRGKPRSGRVEAVPSPVTGLAVVTVAPRTIVTIDLH